MSQGGFQLGVIEVAERVQTQFVSGFTLSGSNVFLSGHTVSGSVRVIFGVEFEGLNSGNQVELDRVPASGSNVVIAKAIGPIQPVNGPSPIYLPPGGSFDPTKPVQVLETQEDLAVILTGLSGASANATIWYWDR